jgi:hypothetical protein
MRRKIVLAIATVLLVSSASAAIAAQVPNNQGKTYATHDNYRIADQQSRFKVGY